MNILNRVLNFMAFYLAMPMGSMGSFQLMQNPKMHLVSKKQPVEMLASKGYGSKKIEQAYCDKLVLKNMEKLQFQLDKLEREKPLKEIKEQVQNLLEHKIHKLAKKLGNGFESGEK